MSDQLDLKHLEAKANEVVAMAMSRGAQTAIAVTQWQSSQKVSCRNGEVEQLSQSETVAVELIVSRDNRRASVESCDLGKDSLETMVDQAVALCRYTDRDPFYRLPDSHRLASEIEDLDLVDPSIETVDTPTRIEMARELEAKMLAQDSRLISNGSAVNSSRIGAAIANSLGFSQTEEETLIRTQVSGFAEDVVKSDDLNSGRKQSGGWASMVRHREDLQKPDLVAKEAAHQILRKLGARKPETGDFPVYFDPRTARSLWGQMTKAILGTSIFRNQSYLTDRIHTQIAVPELSIQDVPRIPRALGSRCFDGEGVTSQTCDLVRDGVLQTYLLSTYSANKLEMETTGHSGGPSNLLIKPGEMDEAEMLKAMGTGLWVTTLLGRGTNLSSGDYSHGALGLWVENGEVSYPVMEFTINSNLDRMFKNITHIGSNVDDTSSVRTPGIIIGEMTISGT